MAESTCSIDGCDRPTKARGWCNMHWLRWKRHGNHGPAETYRVPIVGGEVARRARRAAQAAARRVPNPRPPRLTRDEVNARKRARRLANLAAEKARQQRWNQANKHIKAMHQGRRRARQRDAPGVSTIEQIKARVAYWGDRCWICHGEWTAVDHVKPLIAGGSDWPANLRPICRSCNSRKNGRWYGVRRLADLAA